ncbi:MAG: zinc ribbon domain-containing protein [Planctomycetota bacterium]
MTRKPKPRRPGGPWHVRDKHQPFRPGCCYDVVKNMAKAGKIKSTTVMRGPTTRQFWSIARNVPGVAHLVGYCHECGHHVSPSDAKCGECGAIFSEPRERDSLGLAYKTDEEAELGQKMLQAEINGEPMPSRQVPGPTKKSRPRAAKVDDLLAEVLDLSGDIGPSPVPGTQPVQPGVPAAAIPTAKPKAAPTAIDFVSPPSASQAPAPASAFDVEPTRELPEAGGISTLGLVMIMLNIIAIAAIVVIWLMLR